MATSTCCTGPADRRLRGRGQACDSHCLNSSDVAIAYAVIAHVVVAHEVVAYVVEAYVAMV